MKLPRYFALIPAAGVGTRMSARLPKQYMMLAGKPMLQYALDTFAASDLIAHTFVVVSPDDGYIDDMLSALPHLQGTVTVLRHGGDSRQQSVLNGLHEIRTQLADHDWVLVHDAARPLLDNIMLEQLITAIDATRSAVCWRCRLSTPSSAATPAASRPPCHATNYGRRKRRRCFATACLPMRWNAP